MNTEHQTVMHIYVIIFPFPFTWSLRRNIMQSMWTHARGILRSIKLTSGECKIPFQIHQLVSEFLGLISSHAVSRSVSHKWAVPNVR